MTRRRAVPAANSDALRKDREPPAERLASAHLRQLPAFVIVGAQRGGTTSMYRYLCAHPRVGAALRKEVHYFDRYFDQGLDWYLAHFPERGEYPLVGEASPYYLAHPAAAARARGVIPDAKLIVLLRDPVARASSQYHLNVRHGSEPLSFAEAVEREEERLAEDPDPASAAQRQFSYQRRGRYAEQLERWFASYPRDQFLILRSEDFYAAPGQVLAEVQRFLGLEPHMPGEFKPYHLAEYPELDPPLERRLRAHFAAHNARLADLLGRDFGWGSNR